MVRVANLRAKRMRLALYGCGVAFVVGMALVDSIGLLIVSLDLFVAGRLALAYRDAKRPLQLLNASADLTELAVYGQPWEHQSNAIHPATGLLVVHGGRLVRTAIQVDGVSMTEEEPHPEAGWYLLEREAERGLDRRPLSEAEVKELRTIARLRIVVKRWLLLAGWFFLGGPMSLIDHKNPLPPALVWLCCVGLALVIGLHVYWNLIPLRCWQDRRAKYVLRAEHDGVRIEFLPHTRLLWTEDGQPSGIRREGVLRFYDHDVARSVVMDRDR
jgi:hypothetical protein